MYLFAIIDLFSRFIVGWSISNTMTDEWVVNTINEAIKKHGVPKKINSDQESQVISKGYVNYLKDNNIKISMDEKAGLQIIHSYKDFSELLSTIKST